MKYDLVRYVYIERGFIKLPSDIEIESIVVSWNVLIKFDENEAFAQQFYSSPSRLVLFRLAQNILVDNTSNHWRNICQNS